MHHGRGEKDGKVRKDVMGRMPDVGDVVDEVFRVEQKLDSGNFGTVYKVTDLLEKRTLALKVLRPGTHDEGELRKRFKREATLIYSLQHPHVVRVYYYGQTPTGLPYLAMEYLNGTDLRSLMHSYGQLHDALAKRITLETLSALEAAHQLGIVHRDLKPANIYLVNDGHKGHVKVLDFGFAKAFDDDAAQELTNAQTLVGTPAYMAPELVHKKDVGPAADLYAMGLILAEMILGRKVVEVENVYDTILFQASNKSIKFPSEIKKHPFFPVIQRACQKSRKKRYASATEMIRDLHAIVVEGEDKRDTSPHMADLPVYDDTTTRPASRGLPSLEEIDRVMAGHGSSKSTRTAVRTEHASREPYAPRDSSDYVAQHSPDRARHATPHPRESSPGPQDSQHYVQDHHYYQHGGPSPYEMARSAADARSDDTLSSLSAYQDRPGDILSRDLDMGRPGSTIAPTPEPSSSHSRAILTGALLGALSIGLIVFILYVMT